jgi:molecular chaperone DnaK
VRIEVTFEIDTNGIVNVTASDVETGQKTSCTIRLSSGLTEDMIKSAQEKNAMTTLARGEAAA